MESLRAVFIDWAGTLSVSKFWEHLQDPAHNLAHVPRVIDDIFSSTDSLNYLIVSWMRGQLKSEEVIKVISKRAQVDPDVLLKEFIVSCQNMKFVSDQVPTLVKSIKGKGVKVIVATDNMDSFSRWTVPAMRLDQIFDDVLNSHYRGALKQDVDPEGKSLFFRDYLEENGLKPGQSILIDDSSNNRSVAQKLGIVYKQVPFGKGLTTKLAELVDRLV